jgi:hypothetical protein
MSLTTANAIAAIPNKELKLKFIVSLSVVGRQSDLM